MLWHKKGLEQKASIYPNLKKTWHTSVHTSEVYTATCWRADGDSLRGTRAQLLDIHKLIFLFTVNDSDTQTLCTSLAIKPLTEIDQGVKRKEGL